MNAAYSAEKLAELVLYVARRSEGDTFFGATKLNKVLFFADFLHFRKTGRPITGAEYVKQEHGPVPSAINAIKQRLLQNGSAAEREEPTGIYTQRRLLALRDANLDLFAPEEIAFVDELLRQLDGVTASAVSDWSHQLAGWRLAKMYETIPYFTAFMIHGGNEESDDEVVHAREVARRFLEDTALAS